MANKTALPTGEEKRIMVQEMFDSIAPTYEKTNKVISLGLDRKARKIAADQLQIYKGQRVLDFACGTGDFTRLFKSKGITTISCDLSIGMLLWGTGIDNAIQCDGTKLPLTQNSVDGVICGYSLRNFVDLQSTFIEILRVLKPGARFVALDISIPKNPIIKNINQLWFVKLAPKLGWLISRNKQAYEYLPKSRAYLPEKDEIENLLYLAGAENISVSYLYFGSLILISSTKPPILD